MSPHGPLNNDVEMWIHEEIVRRPWKRLKKKKRSWLRISALYFVDIFNFVNRLTRNRPWEKGRKCNVRYTSSTLSILIKNEINQWHKWLLCPMLYEDPTQVLYVFRFRHIKSHVKKHGADSKHGGSTCRMHWSTEWRHEIVRQTAAIARDRSRTGRLFAYAELQGIMNIIHEFFNQHFSIKLLLWVLRICVCHQY